MAQTMFERYGGFGTLSKVVMAFYDKVLDSDVIGDYFDGVDMRRLIDHQTKFISQIMGGPATYSDPALAHLHSHLAITDAAFDEMTRLFEETLEDFDVDPVDTRTIVGELESRRALIVRG